MKILIILATGSLITFTVDKRTNPDCFSKGYEIMKNIATYQGPEEKGKDQGWILNDSNIEVAGWYCQ
jgi:adenine-specific DNA methylase